LLTLPYSPRLGILDVTAPLAVQLGVGVLTIPVTAWGTLTTGVTAGQSGKVGLDPLGRDAELEDGGLHH
jgi:hypothetical protein